MKSMFVGLSILLCVAAHVISSASVVSNQILSEDEMFDNNKKISQKTIKFLKTLSPKLSSQIGQVGGLDTDPNGNLVIFHRGSRKWSFDSFGFQGDMNKFNTDLYGPIKEKVLALYDIKHGKVLDSWGKDKFYMPHGLAVDHAGNVWLTDVGMHQVFKYDFGESSDEPQLVLGVAFQHGSDENHLCKPTDVAVSVATSDVFVADGYCNQRVVQFDKNGNFIREYTDDKSPLIVAHSVTLIEELGLVCTVSRQQGRIVCFDIKSGDKKHEITHPEMNTVYAIKYDPEHGVIHAASGENSNANSVGLTFDATKANFGKVLNKWDDENRDLTEVHDIAVSPSGSKIYAGQLNGEIDMFTYQ